MKLSTKQLFIYDHLNILGKVDYHVIILDWEGEASSINYVESAQVGHFRIA